MPIVIEHLNYTYSPKTPYEKKALEDITFTVNDGDFFGIIGKTGSGKSTLISHFNGLVKLMDGVLKVDEFDLGKKYDYKALRARVGMVFQYPEYQLFAETVARDVGFGPSNIGLGAEEVNIRVKEAIGLVGLNYDEIAERSPFELSGGQMRRVALAGVIAMRPKILILDEPTAGLDPRGKKEILGLIMRIKQTCPTIIMISHNMDEVAAYCNRIAVLGDGKLRGIFAPEELFGSAELIHEFGLKLPVVSEVAFKLSQSGINIKGNPVTEDALVKAIDEAMKERAKR